jgi:hypothetical protein
LGPTRFFNTHPRIGHDFSAGDYHDLNKCNLFVPDICLRAGFRISIHPIDTTKWHYVDANSYCNNVHRPPNFTAEMADWERIPVKGRSEDREFTWSWKIENWLRRMLSENKDVREELNSALQEEGRCFILAGARARKFRNTPSDCSNVAHSFCKCKPPKAIGHIVIVKEVHDQPSVVPEQRRGEGLQSIRVSTWEARGGGAASRAPAPFQLGGNATDADAVTGFIRLHLFELQPGLDPDTVQGLRDLNIRSQNQNLFGTLDERARSQRLTRTTAGNPREDKRCCHDNWPDDDTFTEGPCT